MALGDNYITDAELKTRLGISDNIDDARITAACDTASREVELVCNRQFNDAGSASQRLFHATSRDWVVVDDFHTTTGLLVSVVEVDSSGVETETVLASTEFRPEPLQTNRHGLVGFPYWAIRNLSSTNAFEAPPQNYVKVTARWGWASVPKAVKEATMILAIEFYKLKDAPFGVQNWGEFGPMRVAENKRVMGLLKQYRISGLRVD